MTSLKLASLPKKLASLPTIFLCFYPILVFYGMKRGVPIRWMSIGLMLFLGVRWGKMLARKVPLYVLISGSLCVLALAWVWSEFSILFYPVVVNLSCLVIFGLSLWIPPPIIERLARLRHPNLDNTGVRYTRKVTQVWCVFFIVNGGIALLTALSGNAVLWAFYNGILAYVFIGLLFVGEWLVRRRVMARGHS